MASTTYSPELITILNADDVENLKILLNNPSHQDTPVSRPNMLLFYAISHNALHSIDYLLSLGANPASEEALFWNLRDPSTFTAIKHLVTQGALDINQIFDWLGTVLILAVKRNDLNHVNFCLQNNANPNLGKTALGFTALATAAEYGASLPIVEALLRAGAEVKGSDALHTSARQNRVDLIQILLDYGGKIDEMGFEYCATKWIAAEAGTALHFAVDSGSVDATKLLLEKGADPWLKDVKGRTAADRGAERESDAALEELVTFLALAMIRY